VVILFFDFVFLTSCLRQVSFSPVAVVGFLCLRQFLLFLVLFAFGKFLVLFACGGFFVFWLLSFPKSKDQILMTNDQKEEREGKEKTSVEKQNIEKLTRPSQVPK